MDVETCRPTEEQLDELAKMGRGFIDNHLDGTSKSMTPQLLVLLFDPATQTTSHQVIVLMVPFNGHEEKHAAMVQQGKRLNDDFKVPMACMLLSEAWVSHQLADAPRQFKKPEDDPARREVAIYHAVALDQRSRHGDRPVTRDAQQRMTIGGEWEIMPPEVRMQSPLLMSFFRGFFSDALKRQLATN